MPELKGLAGCCIGSWLCLEHGQGAEDPAQDPALAGVGAVVLDEFHERSVDADLALALCQECQARLRPDLRCVTNVSWRLARRHRASSLVGTGMQPTVGLKAHLSGPIGQS